MLTRLVPFAALVVAASCACFDNGDKEIGGNCFSFVNQKLSYNDARNWCHYKNPVTASFLASVPNQFTDNFLASYARSAFGTNDGYFWVGLSREKSYTPWTWDTGYTATWTNFENGQLGQNYAAESIVNGKWQTFGEGEKMAFVCMYDPSAPPTFAPPATGPTAAPTTVTPTPFVPTTTDSAFCQYPQWSSTFFFAYSNQLKDATYNSIVPTVISALTNYPYQENILRDAFLDSSDESIRQPRDISSFHADLLANRPSPTSSTVGATNIAQVIRNFIPTAAETSEYSGKTSSWLENSILLLLPVFTGHSGDCLSPQNLTQLTNQNVKVFVLMSNETFESSVRDSNNVFRVLTARTNGHLMVAREDSFSDIVAEMMDFGYGKDLLFSRNTETGLKPLGTLRTPKRDGQPVELIVTITEDDYPELPGISKITFTNRDDGSLEFHVVAMPGTNYRRAVVELPPDREFNVTLDATPPRGTKLMLRMWIDRKMYQYAEFVDLDFRPTNPDDKEGAAVRMTVLNNCYQDERASIRISSCETTSESIYDSTQTSGAPIITEGSYPKFAFVPYFCSASGSAVCAPGTENIYNVQLTVGEYAITRSFECLEGTEPVNPECTHQDAHGNYYCTRESLPYKRGLTGQLTDCLDHGHLEFDSIDTQDYVCICDTGYVGVSCQNNSSLLTDF